MRRIHFIEIQDLAWCPKSVRDAITDNLQFALNLLNLYTPIVSRLERALTRAKTQRIVDLCSGGGGPWLRLSRSLQEVENGPVEICLTDKYPNMEAFERVRGASENRINFHREPVDAMQPPKELEGFRTLFSSFHHFEPEQARAILKDAVKDRRGIGIFEMTARTPLAVLFMVLAPIITLLFTPFIRPFRWSRLVWTYLVPVAPVFAMFDGIVSCLRTYSASELTELTSGLQDCGYTWEIGEEKAALSAVPVTYLVGYPAEETAAC